MLSVVFLVLIIGCLTWTPDFMGPHFHECEFLNNCIERDQSYKLPATETNPAKTMQVRKFYDESDPFNEIFRVMKTFQDTIDKEFSEFDSLFNSPLVRVPDINLLQSKFNLTCTPVVKEGQWYKVQELHCVRNNTNTDVFVEAFTSAPQGDVIPMTQRQVQTPYKNYWVLAICILCIVVIIAVVASVAISKSKKRNADLEEPFVNNRITSSGSNSAVVNYGTF